MRDYNLDNEDIKDIIRGLSVDDCFAGPEQDRDPQYHGWIFKFDPLFEDTKLYIKIRMVGIFYKKGQAPIIGSILYLFSYAFNVWLILNIGKLFSKIKNTSM